MRRLRFASSIIVLLTAAGSAAGSTVQQHEPDEAELTLERAIELALEHNHRLRADQAAVGATELEIDAARARRLPTLDAVTGVQRTDNPVLVFGDKLRQGRFSQQDFALSALNEPEALDNYSAQIVASQPLWTGGRLAGAVGVAVHEHEAALSLHERVRQEVVHQVIATYSGAVLAALELEVANAALETARAQVQLTRDVYEAGLVVESDLLLAEVRESEVRELVIRAQTGVGRSRAALGLAIGRELDESQTLPAELGAVEESGLPGAVEELERLDERARERRPDLDAARRQIAVAETRLALARAERRPALALQGSYETNDPDFFSTDSDNYTLSLGLRIPLFRGGSTRIAIAQAEHRLRQARESAELLEQAVGLEVVTLHSETLAADQRLEQAHRGAALAERGLEILQDRYREGLATLPELLAAEASLTRARMQEVAARRDQILRRAELELATGDL